MIVLDVIPFEDWHTAEYLAREVSLHLQYENHSVLYKSVTDNAANVITACCLI